MLVLLAAAVRGQCEEGSGEDFVVDVDESTITSLVDGFHKVYKGNNKKIKISSSKMIKIGPVSDIYHFLFQD